MSEDEERRREASGNRPATLEELPQDALNGVLSFLRLDELDILSLVSRRIHRGVGRTSHLFSFEEEGRRQVVFSRAGFARLLVRFQSLNVLSVNGLAFLGGDLFIMLNQSTVASTLTKIALHDCYLRDHRPILSDMPNLVHVEIRGVFMAGFGSITSSSNLRSLRLNSRTLRDEDVPNLIRPHRQLESLVLEEYYSVRKPVIQFDRLQTLSIKGCSRFAALPQLSCPNLQCLELESLDIIRGDAVQDIVDSLPSLEKLLLLGCSKVDALDIQSASLKQLDVSSCLSLKVLKLNCPNLTSLATRSSGNLEKLHVVSRQMSKIYVPYTSLVELDVAVHTTLGRLDLFGCTGLRPSECHIRCGSIDSVDIRNTQLKPELFASKTRCILSSRHHYP